MTYKGISQRFQVNNYFAATFNQAEKLHRFTCKSVNLSQTKGD